MAELPESKNKNPTPTLARIFGPLIWISVIIGAPAIAVVSDHIATGLPKELQWIRIVVWVVFICLHITYTVMLRAQLRTVTVDLISAKKSSADTSLPGTAATIASAVALGLSLIVALLLFDYYGHREAVDFVAEEAKFKEAQAERREIQRTQREAAAFSHENLQANVSVEPKHEPSLDSKNENKNQAKKQVNKEKDKLSDANQLSVDKERPSSSSSQESTKPNINKQPPKNISTNSDSESIITEPVANPLQKAGAFLGTFGDFFGGVLNPLLTFGTLVALAVTILLQRTQLDLAEESASRNSAVMEKQAFETTFFNMLNLHNTTVQDLKFDPKTIEIPVWRDDGDEDEDEDIDFDNRNPDMLLAPLNMAEAQGRQVFERVLQLMDSKLHPSTPNAIYHRIQKYHNYVLGHYFRTLYQLLELVDEYSEEAKYDEATRYSSIVRAQLSANELVLLFYNCGYELVDSGQFRKLLKRYEILEHMPLRLGTALGTLDIPGYSFEIEHHVYQYFKRPEDGDTVISEGGAFGDNPVIRNFFLELDSNKLQDSVTIKT